MLIVTDKEVRGRQFWTAKALPPPPDSSALDAIAEALRDRAEVEAVEDPEADALAAQLRAFVARVGGDPDSLVLTALIDAAGEK